MTKPLLACLGGVVLLTVPLRADLSYTMRLEVRPVAIGPQNPAVAALASRVAPLFRLILTGRDGAGAVESTGLLGEQGWRAERIATPGQAATTGVVSIQRPDRSVLFVNPAARTFWTIPGQAGSPDEALEPSVSYTRTGAFDMVAGLKAERIDFEIVLKPVDPRMADAMASDDVTLRLTGQAWVAPASTRYAELAFQTYHRPFGLPWLDQDLRKLGLVVRAVLRGDLLGGFEIEAVLTRADEVTAHAEFDPPAGFAQVEPPPRGQPGRRIDQPVLVTRVDPKYTPAAMRARVEGIVGLDVVVLTDGTVGEVAVTHSLGADSGLDERAIEAVRQWRFTPARINDVPVSIHVKINLTFKLHSGS
jgi:TonB family protein